MKKAITFIVAVALTPAIFAMTDIESVLSAIPAAIQTEAEQDNNQVIKNKIKGEDISSEAYHPFDIYDMFTYSLVNPTYPTFEKRLSNAKVFAAELKRRADGLTEDDNYDYRLEVYHPAKEALEIISRIEAQVPVIDAKMARILEAETTAIKSGNSNTVLVINTLQYTLENQKADLAKKSSYEYRTSKEIDQPQNLVDVMALLYEHEQTKELLKKFEAIR